MLGGRVGSNRRVLSTNQNCHRVGISVVDHRRQRGGPNHDTVGNLHFVLLYRIVFYCCRWLLAFILFFCCCNFVSVVGYELVILLLLVT